MTPPNRTDSGNFKRSVLEDADRVASLDAIVENRLIDHIKDHEGRLREMEKWQWKMMGVGLCVGFIMTAFVGIAAAIITDDIRQLRKDLTPTSSGRR